MKTLFPFCIAFFIYNNFYGQSFLNGSFETHSLSTCSVSLTDAQFNTTVQNVVAFGKTISFIVPANSHYGTCGIQNITCSVTPQSGDWCLGMRSNFGPYSDAIALELDSILTPGTLYYLSFHIYGNFGWRNFENSVELGESLYDSIFGKYIYTATADFLAWKHISFSFTAQDTSKYITVKMLPGFNAWNQFDNFIISTSPIPLGVDAYQEPGFFSFYPNPATTHLILSFANDPEPCVVELYNEMGQSVLEKKITQFPETLLDLASLPEGLYSIRVTSSRTTAGKRVIILR